MNGGDSVDRLQIMRIGLYFGPACFILLTAAWSKLLTDNLISTGVFLLLLGLNIPITLAGVALIYHSVTRASVGLANTLLAAGDIAPPRTYPRQDVLIVRGEYVEAAAYFRDHLRIDPDDCDARLRLADLLERYLADPAGAEREYLDVRRRSPDARREFAATNGLIDLYRRIGRRDRLMVELARLADRHPGTPQGDAAARALRELKADRPA